MASLTFTPEGWRSTLPPPLPDLVIDSVTASPAAPITGDHVVFTAVVRNAGNGPTAGDIALLFEIDGASTTWATDTSGPLAAGASRTISATSGVSGNYWNAAVGSHTVRATVNNTLALPETDVTNNARTIALSVAAGAAAGITAYNGLAQITWQIPAGVTQTSAVVTATSGTDTITGSVGGPTNRVLLGLSIDQQVDPVNYSDGTLRTWTAQVDITGSNGAHTILNLGTFNPSILKPNSAIVGVPTGATGDVRPSAGTLTSITGSQFNSLNTADGQTFTGYRITSGFSLYHGSVANPVIFKNCEIDGVIGLKGGGVYRCAKFIDCTFVLPGTASTGCFTSTNTVQEMVRCEIRGGSDMLQQFRTNSRFKFVYMHGQAPAAGAHADFMQLTSTQTGVWWLGCVYDASDADTSLAGINSVFQGGSWSSNSERMQVAWDHCWFNGSSSGHYLWSGVVPNGTQPGDVVFRNNKFGLHIDSIWYGEDGTDGVHPATAYANGWIVFGDDNVWEVSGTTLGGLTAVAGQPFPKP